MRFDRSINAVRRRAVVTLLLVFVVAATSLRAPVAAAGARQCRPGTAEEMIAAGKSHLNAYLHPETAPFVPLADDARRTELPPGIPRELGGAVAATSAADIRAYYLHSPTVRFIRGYGDYRWVIDRLNCEATVFFLLDFDMPGVIMTVHLGQRFRISDGLIEEIETISWRAPGHSGSCWPANGDPSQGRSGVCARDLTTHPYGAVPGCVPTTRADIVSAASKYLDALETRDGSAVPLAQSARRTEMPPAAGRGPVTGDSGAEVAAGFANDPIFGGVERVRDIRWFVDEDRCQATAFYLVDGDGSSETRRGTRHHVTRFLVSGGMIFEIEDIWRGPIDPSIYEGSCWPQSWPDAEDETYRWFACPAAS